MILSRLWLRRIGTEVCDLEVTKLGYVCSCATVGGGYEPAFLHEENLSYCTPRWALTNQLSLVPGLNPFSFLAQRPLPTPGSDDVGSGADLDD